MKFKKVLNVLAGISLILPTSMISSCKSNGGNDNPVIDPFLYTDAQYFYDNCSKQWLESLTFDQDNEWYKKDIVKLTDYDEINSIMLFTYYGGWDVWNSRLHKNNGEIPASDRGKAFDTGVGFPLAPQTKTTFADGRSESYNFKLDVDSYKVLEKTLAKNTLMPYTVYHGFEKQETEILEKLNKLFGLEDWTADSWKLKENASILQKIDLKQKLIGQKLNYDGFCATSLDKKIAYSFSNNDWWSDNMYNTILYEIRVDDKTQGGYVSQWEKQYYKGWLTAWTQEFQVILNNKLKLDVIDAHWEQTANKNILHICCNGYHE